MGFGLAAWIDQEYFDVAAKFPKNLAACAAGRCEFIGIGRDGDPAKSPHAFRNRLENSDALGAQRQAVSRVLDVAAGVNAAGRVLECRADTEMRIRRVRVLARLERGLEQSIRHARVCRLG